MQRTQKRVVAPAAPAVAPVVVASSITTRQQFAPASLPESQPTVDTPDAIRSPASITEADTVSITFSPTSVVVDPLYHSNMAAVAGGTESFGRLNSGGGDQQASMVMPPPMLLPEAASTPKASSAALQLAQDFGFSCGGLESSVLDLASTEPATPTIRSARLPCFARMCSDTIPGDISL